jgi:hypothetical protein
MLEITLPSRPADGLLRGAWGRQYADGRTTWHAMRTDVRQAHKRQLFRAQCMTLQGYSHDATVALLNAAALRKLLFP